MFRRPRFVKKSPQGGIDVTARKARDRKRKSSRERGYDHKWQRYRDRFLVDNSFCIACCLIPQPSVLIDHIIPVTQDASEETGSADPLFFASWNHEPLCRRHHRIKTDLHDQRLTVARHRLLLQLTDDDENARRQQLLHLTGIWLRWIDLETGEECSGGQAAS